MPPKDRSKRQQVVEREPDVEVTREYREDSESSEGAIVAPGHGEPAFTPDHLQQILQANQQAFMEAQAEANRQTIAEQAEANRQAIAAILASLPPAPVPVPRLPLEYCRSNHPGGQMRTLRQNILINLKRL